MSTSKMPMTGWDKYRKAVTELEYLYGLKIHTKEKNGRLDLTIAGESPDHSHPVWTLMQGIEYSTEQTCQVCADFGSSIDTGHWTFTLCKSCTQERLGTDVEHAEALTRSALAAKAPRKRIYEYISMGSTCTEEIEQFGHISLMYSVLHELQNIKINCKDGTHHYPRRDRPSWTISEIDIMLAELFEANPHFESIDFTWRGQKTAHRATREKPYTSKTAEVTADYAAGKISEKDWIKFLKKSN